MNIPSFTSPCPWLCISCPGCGYQHSLWKLGYGRSPMETKEMEDRCKVWETHYHQLKAKKEGKFYCMDCYSVITKETATKKITDCDENIEFVDYYCPTCNRRVGFDDRVKDDVNCIVGVNYCRGCNKPFIVYESDGITLHQKYICLKCRKYENLI